MSRITLSERTVIEAGIYGRLSLQEIAKKIQKKPKYVSLEIRQNRTLVKCANANGKDCIFSGECKRHRLCGDVNWTRKCVFYREVDCRTVCSRYDNSPCSHLNSTRRSKLDGSTLYELADSARVPKAKRSYDSKGNVFGTERKAVVWGENLFVSRRGTGN